MRKIYFATTNEDKIREAKAILDVDVVGTDIEIDEIQSLDPVVVAIAKARAYHQKLKKPIFVEDGSASFKALNTLPGPYLKDFYEALGNDGLCKLLNGKKRDAVVRVVIVFIDSKNKEHVFTGEVEGEIVAKPRGKKGWGWDPVFRPKGSRKTFGEMTMNEKNKYSMRAIALQHFKKWLDYENSLE